MYRNICPKVIGKTCHMHEASGEGEGACFISQQTFFFNLHIKKNVMIYDFGISSFFCQDFLDKSVPPPPFKDDAIS